MSTTCGRPQGGGGGVKLIVDACGPGKGRLKKPIFLWMSWVDDPLATAWGPFLHSTKMW